MMVDEPHNGPQTYSPSEAATVLDVSKRRVLQMLERGELIGTKDGSGHWRIPGNHVHDLRRQREEAERHKPKPKPEQDTALVEELRDRLRYVEGQLEAERQAHREARQIIGGMVSRLPQLEAPQDAPQQTGNPALPLPLGGTRQARRRHPRRARTRIPALGGVASSDLSTRDSPTHELPTNYPRYARDGCPDAEYLFPRVASSLFGTPDVAGICRSNRLFCIDIRRPVYQLRRITLRRNSRVVRGIVS